MTYIYLLVQKKSKYQTQLTGIKEKINELKARQIVLEENKEVYQPEKTNWSSGFTTGSRSMNVVENEWLELQCSTDRYDLGRYNELWKHHLEKGTIKNSYQYLHLLLSQYNNQLLNNRLNASSCNHHQLVTKLYNRIGEWITSFSEPHTQHLGNKNFAELMDIIEFLTHAKIGYAYYQTITKMLTLYLEKKYDKPQITINKLESILNRKIGSNTLQEFLLGTCDNKVGTITHLIVKKLLSLKDNPDDRLFESFTLNQVFNRVTQYIEGGEEGITSQSELIINLQKYINPYFQNIYTVSVIAQIKFIKHFINHIQNEKQNMEMITLLVKN